MMLRLNGTRAKKICWLVRSRNFHCGFPNTFHWRGPARFSGPDCTRGPRKKPVRPLPGTTKPGTTAFAADSLYEEAVPVKSLVIWVVS